jgi:hypothetical protein
MISEFIPVDIAQFILDKINSVAQLEALLLLRNSPGKTWTIQALAGRLYIDEKQTAELLASVCALGFATTVADEPLQYQYQPNSTEIREMVDRVAEIYSKHLLPVTNLIHSKPKARVQEFADAFKFRKDD